MANSDQMVEAFGRATKFLESLKKQRVEDDMVVMILQTALMVVHDRNPDEARIVIRQGLADVLRVLSVSTDPGPIDA